MLTQRVTAGSTAVVTPIHKSCNVPVQFGDTAPLGSGCGGKERGGCDCGAEQVNLKGSEYYRLGDRAEAEEITVLYVFS